MHFASVVGEDSAEPAPLGGAPVTPTDLLAVAVEDHDVPGSSIVGVVAPGPPRTPSEVIEVGLRPRSVIVVVANRGPGALLVLAPGGIVAVAELRAGAVGVGVVAEGEDGSPYFAQQPCRFAVGLLVALGDISRADQRHRARLPAPSTAVSTAAMDTSSIARPSHRQQQRSCSSPPSSLVWGEGEKWEPPPRCAMKIV